MLYPSSLATPKLLILLRRLPLFSFKKWSSFQGDIACLCTLDLLVILALTSLQKLTLAASKSPRRADSKATLLKTSSESFRGSFGGVGTIFGYETHSTTSYGCCQPRKVLRHL